MSILIGKKIEKKDTLIFFDEIQAVPQALTSLKYFYEQVPEIHIVAAGSLLGVCVGKQTSLPVGKVNFLNLYPMNFSEYLRASGEELLDEKIRNSSEKLPEVLHKKLLDYQKLYLFLGGMPEVLNTFTQVSHLLTS